MGPLRRAMRMDMDDVVRTDAFLASWCLMAIGSFVAGVLVVSHAIPFPLWTGVCALIGGVLGVRTALVARRLFRSSQEPEQ